MADEEQNDNAVVADDGVQAAEFAELTPGGEEAAGPRSLDLIRDIQVTLRVELGRTQMLIEEILALTPGKVVELDKLAGEPLDIWINDKLLARGEVVVVDDNFGVRVTSIVDPRSRLQSLGPGGEERA